MTEESFCRAAVTYAKGRLIAPHEATGLSPEKLAQFRSANIVKMVSTLVQLRTHMHNVLFIL